MKINSFTKVFSILAISLSLFACGEKTTEQASNKATDKIVESSETTISEKQTLNFVGPYDLTVKLTTEDNWKTAVLTDNSDRTFNLKLEPAADGVFLSNDEGVSIHMKNKEATLILVKNGNPINLKEFSNNSDN